jgi:hypothetical protein
LGLSVLLIPQVLWVLSLPLRQLLRLLRLRLLHRHCLQARYLPRSRLDLQLLSALLLPKRRSRQWALWALSEKDRLRRLLL